MYTRDFFYVMVVRGRTPSTRFFMQHTLSRLTAGAAVWAAVTSVFAQSPTPNNAPTSQIPQLSTIVVTPARTPEPLGNTLGDNGVMTREDLETLPNGTLGDTLIRQHSIETINYGGPQTLNTLNIRGTNSNQSLVLIMAYASITQQTAYRRSTLFRSTVSNASKLFAARAAVFTAQMPLAV